MGLVTLKRSQTTTYLLLSSSSSSLLLFLLFGLQVPDCVHGGIALGGTLTH